MYKLGNSGTLFNGPTPASFLFIFVLFKQNFYRKYCRRQRGSTRIVRVEGEHADHCTTTIYRYRNLCVSFSSFDSVDNSKYNLVTLWIRTADLRCRKRPLYQRQCDNVTAHFPVSFPHLFSVTTLQSIDCEAMKACHVLPRYKVYC